MENVKKQQAPAGGPRLRRRPDLRARLVDGEMVVLDRERELIHQLNQTASYVWEQCDGNNTAVAIAGQIAESFEVDGATALRDVLQVVEQLEELKLIEKI